MFDNILKFGPDPSPHQLILASPNCDFADKRQVPECNGDYWPKSRTSFFLFVNLMKCYSYNIEVNELIVLMFISSHTSLFDVVGVKT